jgi:hypothetical protein
MIHMGQYIFAHLQRGCSVFDLDSASTHDLRYDVGQPNAVLTVENSLDYDQYQ